jgi:hypothetical protein
MSGSACWSWPGLQFRWDVLPVYNEKMKVNLLTKIVLNLALFVGTAQMPVALSCAPQPLAANSGPAITQTTTNLAAYPGGVVPRFNKFEITLTLGATYANPFDPNEISVDGYFISPGNATLIQPGFYYQDYQVSGIGGNETYTSNGAPAWKVRFTPKEVGIYQYYVKVTDRSGTSYTTHASFEVNASTSPGFIHVSRVNSRYFEFDGGAPFIGYGLNVAWWQDEHKRIATYTYYLNRMNTYKANLARVWMTNSGKDQNWILSIQDKTLGSHYNLEEAWAFDAILDLAQQKGVYFLLTLDDVNQYANNWADNLYNSALGGPCANRSCIFTNPTAKKYQQQIFRYIIARWGYSPNILSWELFNEIDELQWSDTNNWDWTAVINWHQQMAQYIQSIDAHHHLVNTSTGSFKTHSDLYGLPEMGFAEIHFYYVPGCCSYAPSDPTGRDMADLTRYYAHLLYGSVTNKPSLIGEWGLVNENWINSPYLDADTAGVHLHNGLWSSLMSGMASTGLNWHWDYHKIDDPAWWQHYSSIASFFNGIWIANLTVLKPVNVDFNLPGGSDDSPDAFSSSNSSLRVMGLRNAAFIYGWIQNKTNTWWNFVHATPPIPQSGAITIHDLTPGAHYIVEWWDTYTSTQQIIGTNLLTAQADGTITLNVSSLQKDVAFKVRPVLPFGIYLPAVTDH